LTPKPTVQLSLFQRPDSTKYWEVRVRSNIRLGVARLGFLPFPATPQSISILAGALAEELCEQYRDTLDPSEVARTAQECYREILLDLPTPQPGDEQPNDRAVRVAGYN